MEDAFYGRLCKKLREREQPAAPFQANMYKSQ